MTHPRAELTSEARLLAGDETVLEVLLRNDGPSVAALLRKRFPGVLTDSDVEDVLAAGLFRVWQHRHRFNPQLASLRVWFCRICENVARDLLRLGWHRARRRERSVDHGELQAHAVPVGDESRSAPTLRICPEQLFELLHSLPDHQRRILLADAESRDGAVPSRELAAELGIPPSTVRVYRRRALERLKRAIEQRERAQDPAVPS